MVDETTIIFVFVSLKSVGNLEYHRGIHLSVAGARYYMGQIGLRHFTLADLFIPAPTRLLWKHSSHTAIMRND